MGKKRYKKYRHVRKYISEYQECKDSSSSCSCGSSSESCCKKKCRSKCKDKCQVRCCYPEYYQNFEGPLMPPHIRQQQRQQFMYPGVVHFGNPFFR
jgi:hypothetical protein